MSLNFKSSNSYTSAPTSPAKGVSSFLSRATSLTGSVTNTVQQIARVTSQAAQAIKDRYKILFIIDDHIIDWSKYFRGKRLLGDWDIKVEQAEFKDISLSANSELGALVSIHTIDRSGIKIARTFRPDFVLVRQQVRDANADYSDIILGLKYGMVPSINSLESIYNLQDKVWMFANLLNIQHKFGKEIFPLIEQTFYPAKKDLSQIPKFPCVIKIGHSHNGLGKIKVDNLQQYQDIRSLLLVSQTSCTIEPFVEAKCDLHVQKIGSSYKAFTRKSVSGNWKANVGSALLEQIPVNEKFKKWLDDISDTFGGLELCAVDAVVGKDGKEYIIKVCGSTLSLLGESQEEDRRNIAELIVQRMNSVCRATLIKQQSRASISSRGELDQTDQMSRSGQRVSIGSLHQQQQQQQQLSGGVALNRVEGPTAAPPLPPTGPPITQQQQHASLNRMNSKDLPSYAMNTTAMPVGGTAAVSAFNENNPFANPAEPMVNANPSNPKPPPELPPRPPPEVPSRPVLTKKDSQSAIDDIKDEVDDTMRNLRKTFAGIFGDM